MVQFITLAVILFSSHLSRAQVQGKISVLSDTTHLELTGKSQWNYNVKAEGNRILLEVDTLSPDLASVLSKFKSPHVKKLLIKSGLAAGRDLIEITTANNNVDYFDYLTDQPSRLILDFYTKPEAKTEVSAAKKEKTQKPKSQIKSQRVPANDVIQVNPNGSLGTSIAQASHGLFDGADPEFERFSIKDYEVSEESIIKSRDRFYIPFPWRFDVPSQWNEVLTSPTVYHVNPGLDEENKQMRLLERLFEKKRNLTFLQTADWFQEKYPKSQFNEMVAFMRAETLDRIFVESQAQVDFNRSLQAYREAIESFPKSPLAEKASLSIGIKLYREKDYLSSLRAFNQHIENKKINFSSTLSRDLASLGVALNFMQLQKFEDAKAELEKLKKLTSNPSIREEAAYRLGDIFVLNKKFADAVQEYVQAQKEFPSAQTRFPNAFFNKAEAQFWLGNYRTSLESFREYVKQFPSDGHAPLALTRIGENLEILGADRTRVLGSYLEAYFRYGESLNAVVARIRMTAAKMKNMKPKEVELASQEILDLSKKIDFVDADKFATILISEGYNERGEYDKTLKLLIDYYQQHPLMTQREQFSKRIVSTINQKMGELVSQKKFIDTLKTHQKYSEVWLKNSNRLDTRYFVGASFEQAGVPKQSELYYREVINRLSSIKGTQKEKEVRVVQQLPSSEAIYLRLAKVLFAQKKYQESFEAIKQIRTANGLSDEEQIERVSLSVDLLMEKEDLSSSKRFVLELLKNWSGEPAKMIEPYYKLAQVEYKAKAFDEAVRSLKRVDDLFKDSDSANKETYFKALQLRLAIAEGIKNLDEQVTVSEKILTHFEDSKPVASIRYKLGDLFAKQGQFKKAEEIWANFKGPQADFWRNLAQEQVKHDTWSSDYKKYRSRIPAMSEGGAN